MRLCELLPLLIVAFVAITGCVNDDRGDCYFDDNCVLIFEYPAAAESQFSRFINWVDAFVFDENGYYVISKRSEQSGSDPFRGVRLTLDPGRYYVVAWANVGTRTAYSYSAGINGSFIGYGVEIPADQTESGDQLYYAPGGTGILRSLDETSFLTRSAEMDIYEVVVPYAQTVTKKIDFVRAHRSIYVWSRGYNDIENGVNLCPTAEVTNLWTRYNFMFQTFADRRNFRQRGTETDHEGIVYSLSTFHFAYGEITDDMDVNVYRTSDGQFVKSVNVKDFIAKNPATGTEDIHIMVTFEEGQDLGVSISLPEWIEKGLSPGFE